ncbi:hypothetical protein ABZU75_23365 [Streptosporangium sp. NPDC005286]|uniref:hypothetical protein n=1 Tax=Streptosporangium sp. NPDC005286 TaxID=3154463 RepID=UPI0033AB5F8A
MNQAIRWWQGLRSRVGRRGAALLFFALLDLVFAQGLVWAPAETRSSSTYAFLSTILPLWAWAIPWAAVGLVCLVYAFAREDRPAFIAASGLKVGWAALHLAGWLVGEIPRGYLAAAIWLGFAGFVQVIALPDKQWNR